jgi:hypothetical protein
MSNMNPPITFYDFTILGIFVISIVGFVWGVLRFWWYDLGRYLAGEPKRSLFLEIAHLFITPGYPFYVLYVLFSTHMHPSNLPSLAVSTLLMAVAWYPQAFPHLVDHHSVLFTLRRFKVLKGRDEDCSDRSGDDR